MKKFTSLFVAVFVFSAIFVTASADSGPKPSITVKAQNLPKGEVYMDLLVYALDYDEYVSNGDDWTFSGVTRQYKEGKYNGEMFRLLSDYAIDDWRAALASGARRLLSGDIVCDVSYDGFAKMEYGYMDVPDVFPIIVVTESGEVRVSNTVTKKAFQAIVSFDYAKAVSPEELSASETDSYTPELPISAAESGQFGYYFRTYSLQFLETCGLTLIIEGILLALFKLGSKRNLTVFLVTNVATQLLLTLIIAFCAFSAGIGGLGYIYLLFFAELIIFTVETLIYASLLRSETVKRRVLYAIIANAASCALGFAVLIR
ncbi:MAG: hypothetical protein LBQ91_02040 [Oscillospiraceae bacterium]|jgi:hypothetical protein|nr:hypothetical protein [Oscillospiraceae bacterium]